MPYLLRAPTVVANIRLPIGISVLALQLPHININCQMAFYNLDIK